MSDELIQIPTPKSKDFKLESIENVNHKPHPYCITPKHLEHNDSMYLGDEQIKKMEKKHGPMCGMYVGPNGETSNGFRYGCIRCTVPYEDHVSGKVLFIKALVDKEVKDLKDLDKYLKSIAPTLKKLKIDGVAFVAPEIKQNARSKTKSKSKS